MMIRGIRGATTVEKDTEEEILQKTKQLLEKMIEENKTKPEDVVQMLLSATPDLHSVFPAKAVRELSGWHYVPVTCMQEMDVTGGLKKCIRVMMTVQTEVPQNQIRHVYLEKAVVLRPDLSLTKNNEL
ncbi:MULTISPECIES: chorismate mutase [Bacillus]|uniref:chorismate mutase n=1 Tax=Bacillus TaxID=1386 RepID=UPI000FD8CA43|nr:MULTISPECIES: chorismate mutase [Bacillus]AZV51131.1 chorismate mutase [Bacillus halotolerans]MBV7317811.1 chorismate mutase [Halalkalibacterium halodurans]MCV0023233.1 chorismate mutase [Bacillus sp. XT-2]QNS18538.1 chorismate mutase [Bacillus halotolerans]